MSSRRALATLDELDKDTYAVRMISAHHPLAPANSGGVVIPLPKFSGKDSDWTVFKLEWQDTLAVYESTYKKDFTDQLKLYIFGQCLEDVARKKYNAIHSSQPELGYTEVYRLFEREFGRDVVSQPRRDWENLSIRHINNLTLRDIRTFVSDFDICLSRLGALSEFEKSTKFLTALPPSWHDEIIREQHRRQHRHYWVAFQKPCPLTPEKTLAWVRKLATKPDKVEMEESFGEILVDCGEESLREEILACDGETYKGNIFRISVHSKQLSYKEMSEWIIDRLKMLENTTAKNKEIPAFSQAWEVQHQSYPPTWPMTMHPPALTPLQLTPK